MEHRPVRPRLWCATLTALVVIACDHGGQGLPDAAAEGPLPATCAPAGDQDGDKIPNGVEGCKGGLDSDGDKVPDYQDLDSDNDGIKDGDEDLNGDGLLGCCLATCNKPGSSWQENNCALTADGCGQGQKCKAGACSPAKGFLCAGGESSPVAPFTFGEPDDGAGAVVCRDASAKNLSGRRPVQLRASVAGAWRVALDRDAVYTELKLASARQKEAAATADGPKLGVAGLVASRAPLRSDLATEADALVLAIRAALAGKGSATVRTSGVYGRAHDLYPVVRGMILDINTTSDTDPSTLRNLVLAAMLGRKPGDLGKAPAPFATRSTQHVLRLALVWRHGSKPGEGRLLLAGAVATRYDYGNPMGRAGSLVDDLGGGTALARPVARAVDQCAAAEVQHLPAADIIWVVDDQITPWMLKSAPFSSCASNFFSRALSMGLDFRLGVTNVCDPAGAYKQTVGKLCSKITSNRTDDGGADRFLAPYEQTTFSSCIQNPPGASGGASHGLANVEQSIKRHLPRAANAPDKIRPGAALDIVVLTDQSPVSLTGVLAGKQKTCPLDGTTRAKLDQALAPRLKLLRDNQARLHVVGQQCGGHCSTEVAHGYRELARQVGGHQVDLCQGYLAPALHQILLSIAGAASPVKLHRRPIAGTLAVTLDGTVVKRSRVNGFDYQPDSNSLVLFNVAPKKGSRLVIGYHRWQ